MFTFPICHFLGGGDGTRALQKKQRNLGKEGASETMTPPPYDPLVCALCHAEALQTPRLTRRIQLQTWTTGCCQKGQTHVHIAHWPCLLPPLLYKTSHCHQTMFCNTALSLLKCCESLQSEPRPIIRWPGVLDHFRPHHG